MKEYGGYIEFEHYFGVEYHENALALNSGRSCLAHLIEVKKIKKLYLPYFLCDSIKNVCTRAKIELEYYHIDKSFCPIFEKELKENEYLYVVDFYGQVEKENIEELIIKHERIIVDYAQAFFKKPTVGVDVIYVPRKFFGVADGGYLVTELIESRSYKMDISYERMDFLLGRFEKTAAEFYDKYKTNNERFNSEPIKEMSVLTHNLLRGIDYESVRRKREKNFKFLHSQFININMLKLNVPIGPFAYPLLVENGATLREKLQKRKVYVPTLWPNVIKQCEESTLEYKYAKDILPIPIDQRYGIEDMKFIADTILQLMKQGEK